MAFQSAMSFEWDEAKRYQDLAKHQVHFVDIQALFDGRPLFTAESLRLGEQRFVTTGILDTQSYTIVWT